MLDNLVVLNIVERTRVELLFVVREIYFRFDGFKTFLKALSNKFENE